MVALIRRGKSSWEELLLQRIEEVGGVSRLLSFFVHSTFENKIVL
jgi:hypothetical protein